MVSIIGGNVAAKFNPAKVFQAIRIGFAVLRSIDEIKAGIKAAKEPDSPGGEKVTPGEAVNAVLSGLVHSAPDVYEAVEGEPFPGDIATAVAELK